MVDKEQDFKNKNILVYDIETDDLSVSDAKMKWFGAYSYLHNEYYLLEFPKDKKEIVDLIKEHKVLVSFNGKAFDNPIIDNNLKLNENIFEYKVLVDLYEISASSSAGRDYGKFNKNRLAIMGYRLKNFTLKKIIEELKLDKDIGTKGDIDYTVFQKDTWTNEEVSEIKKYLIQDIDLTISLFQWYHSQFKPLMKFLPKKEQDNFLYIKASLASLAYNIVCNKAGLPVEFGEKPEIRTKSFEGGHHIESKQDLVVGNILEFDFTSAYPHAILMGNLHSNVKEEKEGWNGDGYYTLDGKYNKTTRGKIELALQDIFLERLKAKKEGDKPKDKSYKIVINSFYGLVGNPVFKSVYNRNTASDCTSIVRTWMKKLAKTLEVNEFTPIYGFTDSIFVLIPKHLRKEHAVLIVDKFIEEAKSHLPFPMCLHKDTLIKTINGNVKIKDIKIGEKIINLNGSFIVTNKFVKNEKKLLKITTESGKIIFLTKEHRLLSKSKFKNSGELKKGDKLWVQK
jgi:DNA polymerase elongation subunit (family B)